MTARDGLYPFVFFTLQLIVFGSVAIRIWSSLTARRETVCFFITDFWAACVGLLPSIGLIAYFIQSRNTLNYYHWSFAVALLLGQIGGIIWFRYVAGGPVNDKSLPGISLAVLVLCGAAWGFIAGSVLFFCTAFAAAIVSENVAMAILAVPLFLIVMVLNRNP